MESNSLPPIGVASQPAGLPPLNQPAPLRVVIEQPHSRFGRLGRRLLWIVLAISLLANLSMLGAYRSYFQPDGTINERFHSLNETANDKVAVITIDGLILGGPTSFAKLQIDRVRDDPHVKAVVLRVESPGGTISGSDYLYHHLTKLVDERKIPLVVSMGSIAASGGYYVSMATGDRQQTIFAEPTTWTGSIGVIIPHYDLSGLLDKLSVKDDSTASHPLKQMLSLTRPAPDSVKQEQERIVRKLVDDGFSQFKELVLKSRSALRKNAAWQESVFTGRIFTAQEAKEHGLVDQIGFVEDAVDRAIELAHLEKSNVRVVHYTQPQGLSSLLLSQSKAPSFDLRTLLDATFPRAFYLCTWLPGVTVGQQQ